MSNTHKLDMHTKDKSRENFEKLKALFPNAVTETVKDGKIVHAIDKDILMQEINAEVVEGKDERYQFTWPQKKQAVLLANAPTTKTLRPCRDESVNFDSTKNLYIEGDNLEVLKLLQETYLGKVKMIYIDPPYNTGKDSFVYDDKRTTSAEEYKDMAATDEDGNLVYDFRGNAESNGYFHTDWLNMMYPRLRLARDLLTDDGVIFISIDDNEQENLKKICNEIFGEQNCAGVFPYRKRTTKTDVPFGISQDYEWVLAYTKSSKFIAGLPVDRKYYSSPDYPNDRWRLSDLTTQKIESQRPNSAFDLIDPKTKKVYKYNPNRLWAITKDTFNDYYQKGKIVFSDDYDFLNISIPAYRVFESEDLEKAYKKYGCYNLLKSVSTAFPSFIGMNEQGSKELDNLVGNKVFSFPKPTTLIKFLIEASNTKHGIILDFFSGSATTAHAVMQLNAEDKGKRQFIMVQLPETTDEDSEAYKADYKNICEIGKERIRRAGKKILQENSLTENDLDIGFRVLKLDTTNMKDVHYTPAQYQRSLLDNLENNIKEDRSPEDLLFQVLLDLGVELSGSIASETIGGKTVFNVENNYCTACFDTDLTDAVITEIAKKQPVYAVFRDMSFNSDSVGANVEQIFKTYSPNTKITVL